MMPASVTMKITEFCDARGIGWLPCEIEVSTGEDGKVTKRPKYRGPPAVKRAIADVVDARPSVEPRITQGRKSGMGLYDFCEIIDNHPKLCAAMQDVDARSAPDICIDTRKIAQLDIDYDPKTKIAIDLPEYIQHSPHFLSKTKGLPHVFLKLMDGSPHYTQADGKLKNTHSVWPKTRHSYTDVLHGQWSFCARGVDVFGADLQFMEVSLGNLLAEPVSKNKNTIISMCQPVDAQPTINNKLDINKVDIKNSVAEPIGAQASPVGDDKICDLIALLRATHIDKLGVWKSLCWSLKSEYGDKYRAHIKKCGEQSSFYQNAASYETYFDRLWDFDLEADIAKRKISIGTFFYLLRAGVGDKAYFNVMQKYFRPFNVGIPQHAAESFIDLFGCDWVRHEGICYYFNGHVWAPDCDNDYVLHDYIKKRLYQYYHAQEMQMSAKLGGAEDTDARAALEAKIAPIKKACVHCLEPKLRRSIIDNIKGDLHMKALASPVEWNNNPDTFYFRDVAFDLRTGQQITPSRDDYVFLTSGYDWKTPTAEQMRYLEDEVINKILPIKEVRDWYLLMLATGLTGHRCLKFTVANGEGRNGKTVLNGLMRNAAGEYGYDMPTHLLTTEVKSKAGPDQELTNCKDKRFCRGREPPKGTEFDFAKIKAYTDEQVIAARGLHEKKASQQQGRNCLTIVCDTNEILKLSGTMNEAVKDRINDVYFPSTFMTEEDRERALGDKTHLFIRDERVSEDSWGVEYRGALFQYLLAYTAKYYEIKRSLNTVMPDCIKKRNMAYMEHSDPLKQWIGENYVRSGDADNSVKVSDMYQKYKHDEDFSKLPKKKQLEQNRAWFVSKIQSNMFVRADYKERHQAKGAALRCVLVGWRAKCYGDDEEDAVCVTVEEDEE